MAFIDFPLPILGYSEGLPVDKESQGTSGHMNNVRPTDVLERRIRLGQRPGMDKVYSEQIGSEDAPVVALEPVKIVDPAEGGSSSQASYTNTDLGDSQLGFTSTSWRAQTFTTGPLPYTITSVKLYLGKTGVTSTLTLSIRAVDSEGKPTGADLTSGTLNTEGWAVTPYEWREFEVTPYTLSPNTQYAILCKSNSSSGANWWYDREGTYDGGTVVSSTNGGASWTVSTDYDFFFNVYGLPTYPDEGIYTTKLVALGNHEVWYESTAGTMTELSAANGTISTTSPLSTTNAFQKVFIANNANLKVIDFINTLISTEDVGASASVAPDKGTVLTGGDSGAVMVVDFATTVLSACQLYGYRTTTATFVSGEAVTGTNGRGESVSFTTAAAETSSPHVYTWTPFGNYSTDYGSMPDKARLVCRYRGRLVLAGNSNYPHQYWMSRIGDPWDFLRVEDDELSPVTGSPTDAGEVGDIITALIPYGDDYMVIGGANSVHLMTGDPASGGRVDEVDNTTGVYSQTAWCKDSEGNLYFFGTSGIYKMAGGRSKPVCISNSPLPNLISDWAASQETHRIVLAYDPVRNGIHICNTTMGGGSNLNYWFDLRTNAFYPETYPTGAAVYSGIYYNSSDTDYRKMLLGGADGYIREFLDSAKVDDNGAADSTISAYVTLPIIKMAEEDRKGKLTEIVFEIAGGASSGEYSDSDGFSYALFAGEDAETVLEDIKDGATANESGSVTGTGRKAKIRQKLRGNYLGVKIESTASAQTWAINRCFGQVVPAGRN